MLSNNDFDRQQIVQKLAEPTVKFGVGAIAQVSEYVAEGLKNPQVVDVARGITQSVSKNNQLSKMGASAVVAVAGSAATLPAAVPAAIVIGTASLAIFGLVKLVELISDEF